MLRILDILIQHKLLIFITVNLEKFKQTVVPAVQLLKKPIGQASVQELDTPPNGPFLLQLEKFPGEGSEVDLKRPTVVCFFTYDKLFLEIEKMIRSDGFQSKGFQVNADIEPAGNSFAQCEIDPGVLNGCFLAPLGNDFERAGSKYFRIVFLDDLVEDVIDFGMQEKRLFTRT